VTLAWILAACLAGSLLSLGIAALAAFHARPRWIPTLVSYAVGALLGVVFLDLLPHLFEATKNHARVAAFILFGILVFFVLGKGDALAPPPPQRRRAGQRAGQPRALPRRRPPRPRALGLDDRDRRRVPQLHRRHHHRRAFIADLRLGVVTSIAIIAHEIPQEIGDFLVLLHSGFDKRRALVLNAVSGLSTFVGALVAYFAISEVRQWIPEILAVAAAGMIYVAVADLIPGLQRRTALKETFRPGGLHRARDRQHLAAPHRARRALS
jgi:zinc and cadmium transporter